MNRDLYLDHFINLALEEDIGDGDHTSLACVPPEQKGTARLIAKQEGVLAGVDITSRIFEKVDKQLKLTYYLEDGTYVYKGNTVFEISGKALSILKLERLILNIMQRMSGIATQTFEYVSALKGYNTEILDTRKTTPGMRYLEKEAVSIGGGVNHRMGLYDMILIKDNHIKFAGGITNALKSTQKYLQNNNINLKVEIEAHTLEDIETILEIGGVDIILLDNFSVNKTKKAVELVNGTYKLESSGTITISNIKEYAACGVDFISIGALTHQIKSLDMSLKAIL